MVHQYVCNTLSEFLQKVSFGLKDKLIMILILVVKGQKVTVTSISCECNISGSQHISNKKKMNDDILYLNGQRSTSL